MEREQIDVTLEREETSEDTTGGLDMPPEYCQYRDEGCEFISSCLNCPLPECIYELPGGKQHWQKGLRNKEVVRLFITEGMGVKDLASIFSISQRTVQRVLKGTRNE